MEIPARGHQLTFSNIASPSNILLLALFTTIAVYTFCQAAGYSPQTSTSTLAVIDKIFVIAPVLAQSLFLSYSWIRSAIVVEVIISKRIYTVFYFLVRLSPFIYLLPMIVQFLPLGTWLNFILLICMAFSALLSVTMDIFFTYCFMKIEYQNRQENMEVPAFYFIISRYGILVAFMGFATLATYIASQLAFIKYQEQIFRVDLWILCCAFAVSRDVFLVCVPVGLFVMKAALIRPDVLLGQSSVKTKLSTFFSDGKLDKIGATSPLPLQQQQQSQ
ncbi:hypothetical protein BDR26DRAFT_881131, partial [Obelidium mucronatum]